MKWNIRQALLATLLMWPSAVYADAPITLREIYGLTAPSGLAPARTALLLVDFQRQFWQPPLKLPGAASALRHAQMLLAWARRHGIQVVHVRNQTKRGSPLFAPDTSAVQIMPALTPILGEIVITKQTGGAFTKTDLHEHLQRAGVQQLIVAGLMTHLAVALSATDGSVLGYRVLIAADATATRSLRDSTSGAVVSEREVQRAALAALSDRVADVRSTEQIMRLPFALSPTPGAAMR